MATAERPGWRHLGVLLAVSAGMLAVEVLLLRLFEFSHWHHFAGLAVALALLGLGTAGTCLALLGERALRWGDGLLVAGMILQAAGLLVVLYLHAGVALRPLLAAWNPRELGLLLLVDLAAFLPFFGAGLVIGQIFARWPAESRSIYAANLLGSGLGSAGASVLLTTMVVEQALVVVLVALALAVLAFAVGTRRLAAIAPALVLSAAAVFAAASPPQPAVSDFKALQRVQALPDAKRLDLRPGLRGRLGVWRSDSLRVAPGLSLAWQGAVPASDALILGSDRMLPLPRRYDAPPAHTRATLGSLPLVLRPEGPVLVLGSSRWQTPLAASQRGLTWVEPDARVLRIAAERGMSERNQRLVVDGPYRFLSTTRARYSVIAVDIAHAGRDAAAEDYLMTAQGLRQALQRLRAGGILAVPLQLQVPPRQVARALATLRRALTEAGAADPGAHVALVRGMQDALVLASATPLAPGDITALRHFAERWRFDVAWLGGDSGFEANRFHRLSGPVFRQTAAAVFGDSALPEAARFFVTDAASLDRPYFWRSLEWSRAPDLLGDMGQRALSYLDWTLVLTAISLAAVAILAFTLIVAPLGRLPASAGTIGRGSAVAYFGALGLGYMLVEMALFQRAILFFDEPVLAASVVFAVFLVASGIGSAMAPGNADRRAVARIFASVAAGLVLAALALWAFAGPLVSLSGFLRIALPVACVAALAWTLGRPFPWGLCRLAGQRRWVPWAWGINGFASVLASAAATLISVEWGQHATLGAGTACYAAAATIAWRWVRQAGRGEMQP